MKKLLRLITLLIFVASAAFISCQKEQLSTENQIQPQLKTSSAINASEDIVYCGEATVVPLKTINPEIPVGTVTVGNDENNLYVTYETTDDWLIGITRQYAGDKNLIPGGLEWPQVNKFPFGQVHDPHVQLFTAVIPLESLEECFEVVLWAKVFKTEGGITITNKAFGVFIPSENSECLQWHWEYCKQECNPPPPLGECETAFADGDELGQCFLGLSDFKFKRWGWTNGPIGVTSSTLEWEIWAAAGQCDHSKGVLVGTLFVDYDGSSATATYDMDPGYVLDETHLYVGNTIVPYKSNGKPTVAPGQYGNQHSLGGVASDTYTIDGLSGDIYIIAHAVVCDEE